MSIVEIRVRRVIARNVVSIHGRPNVVSRRSLALVHFADHRELRLMIGLDPVQKRTEDIVRAYPGPESIRYQLNNHIDGDISGGASK